MMGIFKPNIEKLKHERNITGLIAAALRKEAEVRGAAINAILDLARTEKDSFKRSLLLNSLAELKPEPQHPLDRIILWAAGCYSGLPDDQVLSQAVSEFLSDQEPNSEYAISVLRKAVGSNHRLVESLFAGLEHCSERCASLIVELIHLAAHSDSSSMIVSAVEKRPDVLDALNYNQLDSLVAGMAERSGGDAEEALSKMAHFHLAAVPAEEAAIQARKNYLAAKAVLALSKTESLEKHFGPSRSKDLLAHSFKELDDFNPAVKPAAEGLGAAKHYEFLFEVLERSLACAQSPTPTKWKLAAEQLIGAGQLQAVSIVVFRPGENAPDDARAYCQQILEKRYPGSGLRIMSWFVVGVAAISNPLQAYRECVRSGEIADLGSCPFEDYRFYESGNKTAALFFLAR